MKKIILSTFLILLAAIVSYGYTYTTTAYASSNSYFETSGGRYFSSGYWFYTSNIESKTPCFSFGGGTYNQFANIMENSDWIWFGQAEQQYAPISCTGKLRICVGGEASPCDYATAWATLSLMW